MIELTYTIWGIAGVVLIFALLFLIPIFIEVRKMLKAYRIISERLEVVSDVRSWVRIARFFKKNK